MPYVKGKDRNQIQLFCSLGDFVKPDSIARIIDAFVESLDITDYITKEYSREGRPAYNPKSLLKLYIYGSRKGIRSSRKLAEACITNIEVKWMTGDIEPDFRTISDFRKDNIKSLHKIFHEFNRRIFSVILPGYTSVDGSKFRANNSKDNNFTANKLDDRITWLNQHTDEYLRILQEMDEADELDEKGELTKAEIEERLKKAQERLKRYEAYRALMEETGASQISLVDADAKLMKSKNGFEVAYNMQTAVDSETHLIQEYQATNQVTDHGLLETTLETIRQDTPDGILETTADKGYENTEDMLHCLEKGIIPHVVTDDGKDAFEIQTEYRESETDPDSTNPEELKKCLEAGIIPKAYEEYIEDIQVKDIRKKVYDDTPDTQTSGKTEEQMKERAAEGYFVRDPERNIVYCPAGCTLREKCIKKNGSIRYANRQACRHCKYREKCLSPSVDWKEADFTKDQLEKPCMKWLNAENKPVERQDIKRKYHLEKTRVVTFKLKPDRQKTMNRMCLSEHPFGTLKRAMGASYFLLRGLPKVDGEFALMCIGYNIQRALNLLGFEKMMELMRAN